MDPARNANTEVGINDSRLNDRTLILRVNGKNAVHARKDGEDSAVPGKRAAGKACPSAAADKRDLVAICERYDRHNLLGILRKNNVIGARDFDRAVIFVEQKIVRFAENVLHAKYLSEVAENLRVHATHLLTKTRGMRLYCAA
jgi:hypothetical protein